MLATIFYSFFLSWYLWFVCWHDASTLGASSARFSSLFPSSFFFFGQYFSCFVSKVNKWNKKRDCYEKVVYVIFVGPVIWFIFCTFFFSFQLFAFLVSSSWQWESNRGTLYSHPNNAHNFQCVGKAAWHGYSHCLNASNFFSNPSSRFQLFCICFERCVVSDLLKFLLITKAHTKNSHPAFGPFWTSLATANQQSWWAA